MNAIKFSDLFSPLSLNCYIDFIIFHHKRTSPHVERYFPHIYQVYELGFFL